MILRARERERTIKQNENANEEAREKFGKRKMLNMNYKRLTGNGMATSIPFNKNNTNKFH